MDSVKKARKEEGEEVDLEGEVIKALEKLESHQDALDKVCVKGARVFARGCG